MPTARAGALLPGLRLPSTARRGQWGVMAVLVAAIAGAWIALVATQVSGSMSGMPGMAAAGPTTRAAGGSGMAEMAGMTGTSLASASAGPDLGSGVAVWTLMVLAMMLPAALPAVGHVAANSQRWRRRRAMATYVVAYVAAWAAFGALVLILSPLWASGRADAVAAVALAIAAGWQLTVHKRRALRDCHRPWPLPPRGPRATAGGIRFGYRNAWACLRSCWAMMLAMAVAGPAMIFWMVVLTGIVTVEKSARRPRQVTRAAAVVLGAGAIVQGVGALVA
jgi:predicted metal-binding membrane protein